MTERLPGMSLPTWISILHQSACSADVQRARQWVSAELGVPFDRVDALLAIAYVDRHFKLGPHYGWSGFLRAKGHIHHFDTVASWPSGPDSTGSIEQCRCGRRTDTDKPNLP